MKHITLIGAMLIFAILFTACAPAATAAPTLVPTEPAATEPPAATASPAATSTQAAEATATAGIPVTGEETVVKATLSDFGPALVDDEGRALYIYMNDTQNGDSSACTDECATDWEPMISQGDPVAGAGAIQSLLSTITREDGTSQVTYNGWPLYYFSGDRGAGSTNGQGMENVWFLVAPSGKAIQE